MASIQTRNSVLAIVKETTEGTPKAPTLASDYVALQDDFSMEGGFETLRKKVEKINELGKALTAGFGGGSPTEHAGGQVLQTESMENVGKHIDCPSCGKKQIYASYQVRCRNCNKSFPFHVLAKLFINK